MIIAVQGTHKENNNSAGAVAMLSSLSAIRFQKKTLIIQLSNPKDIPLETTLNKDLIKTSYSSSYQFTEKGIDALLAKAYVKDDDESLLSEEQFNKACITVITDNNGVSMLDIAGITTVTDFEASLVQNNGAISKILKSAEKIYECIYILMPHNIELLTEILPLTNINIICVPQAKKQNIEKAEGKQNYILVTDYEFNSSHSLNSIKKAYEVKKIFAMPHNVDYKDASVDCELIKYIFNNAKNDVLDDNFVFIEHLMKLLREFIKDEDMAESDVVMTFDDAEILEREHPITVHEYAQPLTADEFTTATVKTGLFKKETRVVYSGNTETTADEQ